MVVIGSTFGGGTVWLHRPIPDAPLGHTEPFVEPSSLDVFLAGAGIPIGPLDLRTVPTHGPVAERFAELDSIMNGPHAQPVDTRVAFDAVIHVDTVTSWRTFIDAPSRR